MNSRQFLTITAAAGSGLAGGVFFAFSTFVMAALRKLPPVQGVAAMQSINRQAPTAAFMTLLFGTAAVAAGLGIDAIVHHDQAGATWRAAGTSAYLAVILLTAGYHVPRNNHLAGLDPLTKGAATYWRSYLTHWTTANHLRTLGCAAAAVAYTLGSRPSAS